MSSGSFLKMPSLTIEGKREILRMAQRVLGEKKLLEWLKRHQVSSVLYATEHVRRFKAKFFRELFELVRQSSQDNSLSKRSL